MRWRSRRSGAEQNDQQKPEKVDRFSMAIRQRRVWSAQERVRALPGFVGLEHRWCDERGAEELDQRWTDFQADGSPRTWPDAGALAEALRAAAELAPAGTGFARLGEEPEALWVEASVVDLLRAAAGVLGALKKDLAILGPEDRRLFVEVIGDGTSFRTTLAGGWPDGTLQ